MFSKNKNNNSNQSAPASSAAASQSSRKASRSAPSLISADVVLSGNITAGGDMQVDGTVEGDIQTNSLTVGDKASIQGEIVADEVIVRGRIIGSIRARRVQLCSTCHVEGNILHEALAVETGAFFEGNCRHSSDPMSEGTKSSASKPASRESIFSPASDDKGGADASKEAAGIKSAPRRDPKNEVGRKPQPAGAPDGPKKP